MGRGSRRTLGKSYLQPAVTKGGAEASWIVRSTTDRVVWVFGDTLLSKCLSLNPGVSTTGYRRCWSNARPCNGSGSHLGKSRNTPSRFMLQDLGISAKSMLKLLIKLRILIRDISHLVFFFHLAIHHGPNVSPQSCPQTTRFFLLGVLSILVILQLLSAVKHFEGLSNPRKIACSSD